VSVQNERRGVLEEEVHRMLKEGGGGGGGANYSVSKDIPAQNIQSVRIFQPKIFSQ
jgi:hypothetical protein